ncbi:MAG TPA: 16S rRNA (guanine(966)-N(2))-methyltransferase RsmD [Steroidobacteraceae bacterium]|nr:16S rRNA (guanine(966)-N(2))-methyltransferase RsmD [Steroidobacteraceae bacterium]
MSNTPDSRSPKRAASHRRGPRTRTLRIIGGEWRGRRLRFTAEADIRPTPDRVRETLFNWLGMRVQGSRCLDLFAGSGALGLEALSRGALEVQFVESHPQAVRDLQARLAEWHAVGAQVSRGDALAYLAGRARAFDIVFLDPPYTGGLLGAAAAALTSRGWLTRGALIYAECAARTGLPPLPPSWHELKAKQAGEVGYHLLQHEA